MRNKKSGKVLTIFLIIAAVLLASLAAIAVFFFQMEIAQRKIAEQSLAEMKAKSDSFEKQVADLQKQAFLLEDKNKEADERINGLLDEVELQKGLRDELKVEATALREQLEAEVKVKDKIKEQLTSAINEYDIKVKELEAKLQLQINKNVEIQQQKTLSQGASQIEENGASVNLEKIVVVPEGAPQGQVLSVDMDTNFLIVNLGQKNGIAKGNVLAIFRGPEYLGDVKVTRVQDEMAAADFIPPFTSQQVRKNDQVVIK